MTTLIAQGKQEDKDHEQITSLNDVPHGTWQGHRKVAFFLPPRRWCDSGYDTKASPGPAAKTRPAEHQTLLEPADSGVLP